MPYLVVTESAVPISYSITDFYEYPIQLATVSTISGFESSTEK